MLQAKRRRAVAVGLDKLRIDTFIVHYRHSAIQDLATGGI